MWRYGDRLSPIYNKQEMIPDNFDGRFIPEFKITLICIVLLMYLPVIKDSIRSWQWLAYLIKSFQYKNKFRKITHMQYYIYISG